MSNLSIALVIGASVGGAVAGINQLRGSIATLRDDTLGLGDKLKALGQMSASSFMTAGSILAGVGGAAMGIAKPAIDFESSMADVAKVVDGLKDGANQATPAYHALSKEIMEMSARLPMSAGEIAKIVAAGGQSGLAAEELTRFAESATKMGVAFDISADQAGQAMTELRSAFQLDQTGVETLADKINYLGNTTPAAAKGIMEIVQRVGAFGTVAGYNTGTVAALGASMKGFGIAEEVAATSIKNMMLALVAGESATKSQKEAWESLGFNHEQVAKDMQVNAEETTLKVLEAISKLDSYKQASTLKELFGSESLLGIAPLLTNLDTVADTLNRVKDETNYASSMNQEYEARAATTANNIQLLKNRLENTAITLGSIMLPAINSVIASLTPWIEKLTSLIEKHPDVVANILKVVGVIALGTAGFFAMSGAISALMIPVAILGAGFGKLRILMLMANGTYGLLSGAMRLGLPVRGILSAVNAVRRLHILSRLTTVFTVLKSGVMLVGRAILFMGRAMLTNPIGLAITAIALAAYLIYRNWTPIKAFFSDLWTSIKEKTAPIVAFFHGLVSGLSASLAPLKPIFVGIVDGIVSAWQGLTSGISQAIGAVGDWIGAKFTDIQTVVLGFIDGLIGIWQGVMSVFAPLLALFAPMFGSAFNGVISAFSGLWQAISSFVSPMIASLQSFFSFTVSGSQTTGQALGTWIGGRIVALVGIVGGAMSAIRGVFSGGITGLISVITSFNPVGLFARAFAGVAGFFAGLAGRFAGFGRGIVQGLINGISSMIGAAKAKIAQLSSLAIGAAKSTLGINSPSRVFRKIGVGVAHGLTLGVGQGNMRVSQASGKLAQSLIKSFVPRTVPMNVNQVKPQTNPQINKPLIQLPVMSLAPKADAANKSEFKFAFTPLERTFSEVNHNNHAQSQTINVHFNPVIHADNAQQGQIQQGLQMSLREFEQMLRRVQEDQRRRAYV